VNVHGDDAAVLGRAFSNAAVELALASYPGFTLTSPPGDATPYGIYWPALVPAEEVEHVVVHADGRRELIPHTPPTPPTPDPTPTTPDPTPSLSPAPAPAPETITADRHARTGGPAGSDHLLGEVRRVPLGTLIGARSGDKGGNANVGLWARTDEAADWLLSWLDEKAFRALLPEADGLRVEIYPLPNLRAVNVVVVGLLGEGVAASTRFDPQAKGLGEYLRSRHVDIPVTLLP
jgi:hypothetical protein